MKITQIIKNFLVGSFIIVVVSSAVFLIYTLSLRRPGPPPPSLVQEVAPVTPAETTATVTPAETAAVKIEHPVVKPPKPQIVPGAYTVYIAAYPSEPPASEEVSRWREAAYDASVIFINNHYCVALGHYNKLEEAHAFAEKMSEAFENGYIIGRMK